MRIEANVPIRRKKKAWMNNKISQIEYNLTKEMMQGNSSKK